MIKQAGRIRFGKTKKTNTNKMRLVRRKDVKQKARILSQVHEPTNQSD